MIKPSLFAIILLTTIRQSTFAQNMPIQLDRPDQTECPFIVPKGYVQLENGFGIENIAAGEKSFTHPSTLWKYGVNEQFELRLITELVTEKSGNNNTTGLQPITIGFKTKLVEEKGVIPMVSFIGHITTSNVGSKPFHTSYIAPLFRFTMQHTLSEKVSLAYNLGAAWNGENAEQTLLYTLTTGIALTEKIGCYAELFGFAPADQKAEHNFDGGFTYLVSNNVMLDLSGGIGLTDSAPDNYIAMGFSFRFATKKK